MAWQRVASWVEWHRLDTMRRFERARVEADRDLAETEQAWRQGLTASQRAALTRLESEVEDTAGRFAAEEIALALNLSVASVDKQLRLADDLHDVHRDLGEALEAGQVSGFVAAMVAQATRRLPDPTAAGPSGHQRRDRAARRPRDTSCPGPHRRARRGCRRRGPASSPRPVGVPQTPGRRDGDDRRSPARSRRDPRIPPPRRHRPNQTKRRRPANPRPATQRRTHHAPDRCCRRLTGRLILAQLSRLLRTGRRPHRCRSRS